MRGWDIENSFHKKKKVETIQIPAWSYPLVLVNKLGTKYKQNIPFNIMSTFSKKVIHHCTLMFRTPVKSDVHSFRPFFSTLCLSEIPPTIYILFMLGVAFWMSPRWISIMLSLGVKRVAMCIYVFSLPGYWHIYILSPSALALAGMHSTSSLFYYDMVTK